MRCIGVLYHNDSAQAPAIKAGRTYREASEVTMSGDLGMLTSQCAAGTTGAIAGL